MSINNWFPLEAPAHPNHIISVSYFIMNCARCAWAYITTAEFYCGHVRWRSFWFSECFVLLADASFMHSCWLWPAAHTQDRDSSCTTPRRHRACPASAGRQQGTGGKKLLFESVYPPVKLAGKNVSTVITKQEQMISYFLILASWSHSLVFFSSTILLWEITWYKQMMLMLIKKHHLFTHTGCMECFNERI